MRRHCVLLLAGLVLGASAAAEDMRPIKDPVPSPSDLRAASGEDRP